MSVEGEHGQECLHEEGPLPGGGRDDAEELPGIGGEGRLRPSRAGHLPLVGDGPTGNISQYLGVTTCEYFIKWCVVEEFVE